MASFNKFNAFVQDVGQKKHNLNADTLKVMLTNVAPVATNAVLADLTEITPANGYSAGGSAVPANAFSQAGGIGKLTGSNVVFTAAGGSFGPFRYAALYNASAAGGPLIGWFDYGSAISVNNGDTFTVSWDAVNGILTLT